MKIFVGSDGIADDVHLQARCLARRSYSDQIRVSQIEPKAGRGRGSCGLKDVYDDHDGDPTQPFEKLNGEADTHVTPIFLSSFLTLSKPFVQGNMANDFSHLTSKLTSSLAQGPRKYLSGGIQSPDQLPISKTDVGVFLLR